VCVCVCVCVFVCVFVCVCLCVCVCVLLRRLIPYMMIIFFYNHYFSNDLLFVISSMLASPVTHSHDSCTFYYTIRVSMLLVVSMLWCHIFVAHVLVFTYTEIVVSG